MRLAAFVACIITLLVSANANCATISLDPKWVESNIDKPIPPHAVPGGTYDGYTVYVCRAYVNSGVHPGKLEDGRCLVVWGGTAYARDTYEVLVGNSDERLWTWREGVPDNAYVGGHKSIGTPLAVCRGRRDEGFLGLGTPSFHPGKIEDGKCVYVYKGQVFKETKDFGVLLTELSEPDAESSAP